MREKSLKDQLKQMDQREKEMEEELGGLVVDEHQALKRSTTETSSKTKL